MAKAGLSSHVSQTLMPKIGCKVTVYGGMTPQHLVEKLLIRHPTWIWYRRHSGVSTEPSSKLHAATIHSILHCCRPRETAWVDRRSDPKWQAMEISGDLFGALTVVGGVARCNMAASIRALKVLEKQRVALIFKVPTISASGVTGVLAMVLWWWLAEEEIRVYVPTTGLASRNKTLHNSVSRKALTFGKQ